MKWLLILLGGGYLLWRKESPAIMQGARNLMAQIETAVGQLAFKTILPAAAKDYADIILQVAKEQSVDPFVIVALGWRETRWGTARALSEQGPAGTGDSGHGRGLMQIDDRTNGPWLDANDWTDPYTNITKGVQILKGKMAFFANKSPVKGLTDGRTVYLGPNAAAARGVSTGNYPDPRPLSDPSKAAVAAYNTGEGNVLRSLACGVDPDKTTAPGPSGQPDYSADVLATAQALSTQFTSIA